MWGESAGDIAAGNKETSETEEEVDGCGEGGHAEAGAEEEDTENRTRWRVMTRCGDPE